MTTARDRPPEEAAEDTSFARGLRLLLTIADRGEVRADELGTILDMPLSTVYRYLRTLAGFGFVDRRGGAYRLGPRLIIGSGAVITSEVLIRVADPVLRTLVEETGETAFISRRVGLSAVCLHALESDQPLRVSLELGESSPLGMGAASKVLLAFAPTEILDEVLADGLSSPPTDLAREAALRAEVAAIVDDGMAVSIAEVVPGTVSLAVPILREDGIVAAVGVIGPDARCGPAWRSRVATVLPGAARSIAGALAS